MCINARLNEKLVLLPVEELENMCMKLTVVLSSGPFIFGFITYKHTANISYFIWAILFIAVMLMFNNTSSFS
ncbi:hypothetical protein EB796_000708 [Bugula neritina]|uniref:Uncharacterized protein n=1 Tax=Bugula neritina TaxID=10212 RepID=A0A7J7KS20_BUGNE|nr:hypothetical protein EB796_000708 [Bugula neritina]